MNLLTMLLARILAGEPYQPATGKDTRIWISLLAAFPFPIAAGIFTAPHMEDASFFLIWLSSVMGALVLLVMWRNFFRRFQLWTLGAIAFAGWLLAFAAVIQIR